MSSTESTSSTLFSIAGSVGAFVMVLHSLTTFIPVELKDYIIIWIRKLLNLLKSPKVTIIIPEYDGLVNNEVYEAAQIYLGGKINPATRCLRLSKPKGDKNFKVTVEKGQEVFDIFDNVKFSWRRVHEKLNESIIQSSENPKNILQPPEIRHYQLTFDAKDKDKALESYVPYVLEKATSIAATKKTVKLFTVDIYGLYESLGNAWNPVYLEHPSTFDTLALDPMLKKTILDDLKGFVNRKEFYKSVGKAWKRGYLLYGPPGTGKSSLVAAMANYLNFDIYDLDLSGIEKNFELRRLMLATANRSILVVEDIDCGIQLQNREKETDQHKHKKQQVTLSAVLNLVDGLWSSCGDERIIIFTTNYKEKLDPALLRPGRMDMHIHLSYCTPSAFDVLAFNYLKLNDHPLFEDIKQLLEKVEVTPADVAERLLKNDTSDVVLQELLDFLESKKIQQDEARAKETQEQEKQIEEKENKSSQDEGVKVNETSDTTSDSDQ